MRARLVPTLLAAVLLANAAAAADKPNILFILADDLGWRDLGCYGSTFYETPHLDRLAARSMVFPNAYSASPLCSPTRAALLTGQHPARLRLTTPACHLPKVVLDPIVDEKASPLKPLVEPGTCTRLRNGYLTYAEVLKTRGYRTAFMGKWHLGKDPYLPDNQGFDVVIGGRGFPGPPGGYFAPWPIDTLPKAPAGSHIDEVVTGEAIKFIESSSKSAHPFLLNLWFYSVHAPFEAKEGLIEKYRAKAKKHPGDPQASPVMAAMLETFDGCVGRVIESLDRLGLAESTLVLFTSDNGGNNYNLADGVQVTSNAPLRNGKGNNYEGGQRVPLFACWPGQIAAGTKSNALVTSVDVFPSILEATGVDPLAYPRDGQSFLPILTGKAKPDPDRAVFSHFPHSPPATGARPSTSVRRGDWKLLRFYGDGAERADRHALYNLAKDIGETNDLSAARPELTADLAALVDRHLHSTEALRPKPNPAWRPSHDGWTGNKHAKVSLDRVGGTLQIASSGNDPFITTSLLRTRPGTISVELRAKSNLEGKGTFYFASDNQPFAAERTAAVALKADHEWHTYRVDFTAKDPVRKFRFDPGNSPGRFELDWLRVITWTTPTGGKVAKHWDF